MSDGIRPATLGSNSAKEGVTVFVAAVMPPLESSAGILTKLCLEPDTAFACCGSYQLLRLPPFHEILNVQ